MRQWSVLLARPALLALLVLPAACNAYAYTNERLKPEHRAPGVPPPASRANRLPDEPRGDPDVVVLLALSGGGSRAAWFGGAVMLELEKILLPELNLLHEVDVISAVSGGALPAAYYCLSKDDVPGAADDPPRRTWNERSVRRLMTKNYLGRWVANWFWPTNALKYWFTAFDRGDVMAQTLADNLFDVPGFRGWGLGRDQKFGDLNPQRPYLILNATDATRANPDCSDDPKAAAVRSRRFGAILTFTTQDFKDELGSDINSYPIADAVMATAAFPLVFPFRTLRDYRAESGKGKQYVHVFDGGNADNLGLMSVKKVIDHFEAKQPRPRGYIVICIDAYTEPFGIDACEADPRGVSGRFIDSNAIAAVDMLLKRNRLNVLAEFYSPEQARHVVAQKKERATLLDQVAVQDDTPVFEKAIAQEPEDGERLDPTTPLVFWHITFDDIEDLTDRERLYAIETNFNLAEGDDDAIARGAKELMNPAREENRKVIREIRRLLRLPAAD